MSKPATLLGSFAICHSRPSSELIRHYARPLQCLNSGRVRRVHTTFECGTIRVSTQVPARTRRYHTSPVSRTPRPPRTRDRGPRSEETTQTDFGELNVFSKVPPPASSIDSCLEDGFELANGVRVEEAGVLLVGGEVFSWRPKAGGLENLGQGSFLNTKGQWEVPQESLGILSMVWPRPDLLIIGTGLSIAPLSPTTRTAINEMGIRVEALDTRNAAAQYNLLATERGVHEIAAAMVPIGWAKKTQKS